MSDNYFKYELKQGEERGSDYSQLTLTCTTNEWNKDRVFAISKFFWLQGAEVQNIHLKRCDYHIEGLYRDVEVNLGIEHKTLLGDFFPSLAGDMQAKLIESYQYYDEVALFIEEGNYSIKFTDDGLDAYILNPAMQAVSGLDGVGTLASYNNFCGQLAKTDIHVRAFRTVNHFPITVSGLLKSIVKPIHDTPSIDNPTQNYDLYKGLLNMLVKLPGIGVKTAEKGLKYIPNLSHFNSMQLSDLRDIFGGSQGSKVYAFLNDGSRIKECALAWEQLYEKNAPKRKEELNRQIKANKKSEVKGKVTPTQEKPFKSNPDKPFYSGELAYLNDNKQTFKEVEVNKLQSSNNSNLTDTAMNSPVIHDSPGTLKESGVLRDGVGDLPVSDKLTGLDAGRQATSGKPPANVGSNPTHPNTITDINIKESDLAPRIKDVVEFIRMKPRTLEEVRDYFDFTTEYCFKTLMEFKLAKKIWFENSTKTWQYGLDRNPMPIVAKPEMDIGV